MEVILLERVAKLGQMGETVKVRDGYARNFLLARGKALRATKQNKERFETQRAQLRVVNENYVQARAAAGVQVSAQATAADEQLTNTQTDRTFEGQSLGATLTVSQPLFAGGRIAADALQGGTREGPLRA